MTALRGRLERVRLLCLLTAQRLRALLLRVRGAQLDPKVRIGRGVLVDMPVGLKMGTRVLLEHNVYLKIVSSGAVLEIGEFTFVGAGVEIDVLERVSIGSHTLIAPGCFITDHNHGMDPSKRFDQQECTAAGVSIGSDVWIGANSVILPGVTISNGAVVAAGAVVNRNVSEWEVVAGVPAKRIGNRARGSAALTA